MKVEPYLRVDIGESGVHVHWELVLEDRSSRHHGQERTSGGHSASQPFVEGVSYFCLSENSRGVFGVDVDVAPVSFEQQKVLFTLIEI